jgi:alpha-N-arabinofuranosidase
MQRVLTTLLPALLLTALFTAAADAQTALDSLQANVTNIHINAAKPAGYRIPRTIFGSFLEPIAN